MQKLHLKVRNLLIRNLQMRMPGVSSPALPPFAPSRIPFRLSLSIRVPQILSPSGASTATEKRENRCCASNRIPFGQAASKRRNGGFSDVLGHFHCGR
jgi:hypothetical protein